MIFVEMLVPAYQTTRHKPKIGGRLAAILLNTLEAPTSNPSPKTRQTYSSVLRENFQVIKTNLVITVPFHTLSNQSYINHRVIWRCKIWDIDGVAKWTTNNTVRHIRQQARDSCVTLAHSAVSHRCSVLFLSLARVRYCVRDTFSELIKEM